MTLAFTPESVRLPNTVPNSVPNILSLVTPAIFLSIVALPLFIFQTAFAEERSDEAIGGERVLRAPASVSNGIARKRYPGGADEDDLQVQATLPIPSRTFDGSPVVGQSGGESSEGQASPATGD